MRYLCAIDTVASGLSVHVHFSYPPGMGMGLLLISPSNSILTGHMDSLNKHPVGSQTVKP